MKKCKTCGIEKSFEKYYVCPSCKDGYHSSCKECEALKSKVKTKSKKSEYRPTKKLINPEHPIPVKMVGDDGFGGKWKFDIEQLKSSSVALDICRKHGQKNHMVRRNLRCLQVKQDSLIAMTLFCSEIGMNHHAIIQFNKPEKPVYVVNLFHSNILEVVK